MSMFKDHVHLAELITEIKSSDTFNQERNREWKVGKKNQQQNKTTATTKKQTTNPNSNLQTFFQVI